MIPLVPEDTTAGAMANLFSPYRGVCHGVKVPDSNPPFTRVGAQVFAGIVKVEEELVDRVTVVRVDDVMTESERWSAIERDVNTYIDLLEEILRVVEYVWMVVTVASTDFEVLEESLKSNVVELALCNTELGAAKFDCDDKTVL